MTNIKDTALTEEELDNVSGGREYEYELKEGPKGKYYRCISTDGLKTRNIAFDRWVEWLQLLKDRGDTIHAKK